MQKGKRTIAQNNDNQERTAINLTTNYVAYCGNDCTQCPQYKLDCAEGCLGFACANYCATCIVRLCSLERLSANCAQCPDYPCQKLEKQFDNMANDGFGHWAIAARKVLEEIHQSKLISNQK